LGVLSRTPEPPFIATACTYDCPDACSLRVSLAPDGSARIAGDPGHPITRGFVCYRIHRHARRLRHPERLLRPRLRFGSGFVEIDWERALALAGERLREALQLDPASVLCHVGGGSLGLSKELISHFFHRLGPVTTVRGGPCGEAGEAAQALDFGDTACHDYSDLAHSRAVVLWGKNPAATGVHLLPFLKEARARGARIVAINPLPVESERLAERVIRVAPSGDGFLALGVLRLLLERGALPAGARARAENWPAVEAVLRRGEHAPERCAELAGVGRDALERLAEIYAEQPVATWVGWGLQRSSTGGCNLRWIDALGLLSGQVGIPGGGVNFTSRRRRGLALERLARASGRTLSAPSFARELAALRDPALRFVYLAGANPVTQLADSRASASALRGAGFVVVADAFMTDTALAADLVLPVRLMLEEDDVVGSYQHHHVAPVSRALEPPPGPRGDLEILRAIGEHAGLTPDPLLADPARALASLTAPWFEGEPPRPRRSPLQPPCPFHDRFPTPSGRARLVEEPPVPLAARAGFPLLLLTPSSRRWQTSQLFPEEQQELPTCAVHPEAASAAGLGDGERAWLQSPLGALEVRLRLDPRMRPEVCAVARGGALAHGWGVNALIEARTTDLGDGVAFFDQRVRLERAP
jgi:anaerobic selenocysteine-containing dehydrogenase